MKIKAQTYFLLIILAAYLLMFALTLQLSAATKFVPLILGTFALVLITLELVTELRSAKKPTESRTTTIGAETHGQAAAKNAVTKYRAYALALSWSAGFLVGIYLFGYTAAIAALVLTFLKSHSTTWVQSIIYAVLITTLMHVVFEVLMKADLWPGIIPPLFLP